MSSKSISDCAVLLAGPEVEQTHFPVLSLYTRRDRNSQGLGRLEESTCELVAVLDSVSLQFFEIIDDQWSVSDRW